MEFEIPSIDSLGTAITSTSSTDFFYSLIAGGGIALLIVAGIIILCLIIAYFLTIGTLVRCAHQKKTTCHTFTLWFLGLFATPVTLGIIVCAMPDRSSKHQV